MSLSGPTKACPRCNAALPAQAVFCGSCGWQFSAPASPAAASAPAVGQAASGAWPQSQPIAQASAQPQSPAMPGYPLPGQPGAAGYAPVAAAPKKGISPKLLAVILVAAVITVGIPGYLVFGGQGGSGLLTDRHGLPSNVPLPSSATFKLMKDEGDNSGAAKAWYWTVDSPNDPSTVEQYYQSNLASNGWTNILHRGSDGDYEVTGCNGNQAVYVAMNASLSVYEAQGSDPSSITGPSGGSALDILVSSQPDTLSYAECS